MRLKASSHVAGNTGVRPVKMGEYIVISDSAPGLAGNSLGPSSPEMLLGALASCLIHTYLLQASLLAIPLDNVEVTIGTIVLGTVRGDLHDIGKNLAGMLLEGAGFRVVDIGVDAGADKFVNAVKAHNAQLVGLSALLTTTMMHASEVLTALESAGLRQQVKVVVGGAAVTPEWAAQIGADGAAIDAATGAQLCKELLAQLNG